MTIQHWEDISNKPLTLENVKKLYSSTKNCRINVNAHDPSDSHPETGFWMDSLGFVTYYILQGSAVYVNRDTGEQTKVSVGDVIKLPSGKYVCRITSEILFKFIQVFELPEGLY